MDRTKAKEIAAAWMLWLWIERPEWMTKMPDQKAVDKLIDLLVTETK